MPIIEITSLEHPGVQTYSTLTEAQLRNRLEPDKGIFIAESPKVIHVALDAGYEPLSLLCEMLTWRLDLNTSSKIICVLPVHPPPPIPR